MHRLRAAIVPLLVVIVSAAISMPAFAATNDAKKKPKGPKVVFDDSCSMLWLTRVEKALGGPVAILPEGPIAGPAVCTAALGVDPAVDPGGILTAIIEFPTIFNGNPTARAAVDDRRAGDVLSEDVVTDIEDLGRAAYFNRTKGTISVAVSKKFAFTLQWVRAGAVEISDADRAKLTSLARNVVARFTR